MRRHADGAASLPVSSVTPESVGAMRKHAEGAASLTPESNGGDKQGIGAVLSIPVSLVTPESVTTPESNGGERHGWGVASGATPVSDIDESVRHGCGRASPLSGVAYSRHGAGGEQASVAASARELIAATTKRRRRARMAAVSCASGESSWSSRLGSSLIEASLMMDDTLPRNRGRSQLVAAGEISDNEAFGGEHSTQDGERGVGVEGGRAREEIGCGEAVFGPGVHAQVTLGDEEHAGRSLRNEPVKRGSDDGGSRGERGASQGAFDEGHVVEERGVALVQIREDVTAERGSK